MAIAGSEGGHKVGKAAAALLATALVALVAPILGPVAPATAASATAPAAPAQATATPAPATATPAPATAPPAPATAPPGTSYRHGAVRPVGTPAPGAGAALHVNLSYGGGNAGVGVTTGAPRVYLVFWGSHWGTSATNGQGYLTLSGDAKAVAPDVQGFFKGLGTASELWSGVMTQYCEGVAQGAQTCPAASAHVAYPTGGAVAGVWADTTAAAPATATGHQLAIEALGAANHFGNTSQAANRNTQYFIVSPSGTHPDGFNTLGQFCAWHDFSADPTLPGGAASSPFAVAFTNMPYVTDAGGSCGTNFVNGGSAGTLDGVTIVGGHEYAETITDQFPNGGWLDTALNENADKCSWIHAGQGAAQNIALSTGSFPVQSTWANDFNGGGGGCLVSHPIVGLPNTVTVTNPGSQTGTAGTPATLQVAASDSAGAALTYSVTGLPAGLTIAPATGLISGSPTTAGTSSVTVTATDATTASGSTTFSWTVNPASTCTIGQLLGNPGFETGHAPPWKATAGVVSAAGSEAAHSGTWMALLGGQGVAETGSVRQSVVVPAGCTNDTFSFWRHIDTTRPPATKATDTLKVQVLDGPGTTILATLATYSNTDAASGFSLVSFNVSAYAGQTITLRFAGREFGSATTTFVIDDAAFNVS
jgi:hypothetical protein